MTPLGHSAAHFVKCRDCGTEIDSSLHPDRLCPACEDLAARKNGEAWR